jgi:hypothetical protein
MEDRLVLAYDRGDGVVLAPVQFVHAKQVVLDVSGALA